MKELCTKFLSFLHYVPYIVDEKPKIHYFLSCLPHIYKERIEYDNPKTLEETMRNEKLYYDQNKKRKDNVPSWDGKRPENFEQRNKGTKFHKNYGTNY